MAEVSKRENQAKAINKLAGFSDRLNESTPHADVVVRNRELGAAWKRYQLLHDAVLDRAGKSELDEQQSIYETDYEIYLKTSSNFNQWLQEHETSPTAAEHPPTNHRHHSIARIIVNIEKRTSDNIATMNSAVAVPQLTTLRDLYCKYQDAILDYMSSAADEDAAAAIESQADIGDSYMRASAMLSGLINVNADPLPPPGAHRQDELKVPALQISAFDGTPAKWESFRGAFEQVFHTRASMPAVQKLQHLKGSLRGDALELVENFALTNENYTAAWNLLKQRYDDPYELTRAHIRVLTSLPACKGSADDLRRLLNRASSTLLALKNLQRPVDQWDDLVVHHIVEKVDNESRKAWEQRPRNAQDFPKWTDLETFLVNRLRSLNAMGFASKPTTSSPSYVSPSQKKVRSHVVTRQPAKVAGFACPCCQDQHAIYMCHTFRRMSPQDRRAVVADKKLCFNCLDAKHMAAQCTSNRRCRFCDHAHNSLLHIESAAVAEQQVSANHSALAPNSNMHVLLATAVVRVRASNGALHEFRALLDQGSQASLITERAAQLLNLPRRRVDCQLIGVAATPSGRSTQAVTAQISSRVGDFCVTMDALVLRRVAQAVDLPAGAVTNWPHLRGLSLADPNYEGTYRLDILIGADLYGALLLPEVRKGPLGSPVAQNTSLGWIISGPSHSTSVTAPTIAVNFATINEKVDDCLEKFWAIEDIGTRRRVKTIDEDTCEEHFASTFTRDNNGRFHVRIPFRNRHPVLGESLQMATQRQFQMERKFLANSAFASEYRKFMSQYHELGHMTLIGDLPSLPPIRQPHYFIPHHAVLKESSSTTKLRVVFDASRRSTNGLSLNEQMLPGPRLQDDLSTIVMRWRKHRIVFTADVERMYRQIIIDEPDADYQRIVWRASTEKSMQVFQLSTVTYGTTSAPYLAVKALLTLAELERERFPIGAEIAMRDFYVDDVLTGFDDVTTAMRGQDELRRLMHAGGFELKKWTSNCGALLEHLPDGYCECRVPLELNLDQHVKTLGIQWNPVSDTFSFKIAFVNDAQIATKREFLSDAARLYDPLGWLAPSVILVKIMFQKLWQLKLGWDDRLPPPLAESWPQLRQSFCDLQHLRIERWVSCTTSSNIELHGFCDSSINAYAAAVYLRTTSTEGVIKSHLLCAKTKVAPLKTISLPRLELCGAALLCQLMLNVQTSMRFGDVASYCWTDSTIVLAWIKGSSSRWSVFVANRVAEIQRHFPIHHWRHVSSEDNPADCASRGVSPDSLASHPLWWSGPPWLSHSPDEWPSLTSIADTTEEMKSSAVAMNITLNDSSDLKNKYSSLHRLIRITAHCRRFIFNTRRPPEERVIGPLRTDELQAARIVWIKDAQREHFSAEIACLTRQQPIRHSSTLRSLNPTLHADGVLRVGGRLVNALVMPEQAKTPIIIPRRCHLSELLISHAHDHTFHGGPSLMLAHLRRQFWIVDGPRHVRQFVKRCNKCFRYASSLGHQMMSALPAARVTPSRPFSHTAMDYSGAVMLRSAKGRGHHATKGYISVFVCLATKAIHIELVSDLTSAAFIAAYKRFTGRRGICSDLYSDNATNYVGAAAIFSKTERDLGFDNTVISALAMMGTVWHFSPPLAPHFNGLAESAIRSVKHHVRRIVGDATLTYEELITFLIQVECCLNSRPLYPMSSDPSDVAVLTPAHFLTGAALNSVPERSILSAKPHALTRWQQIQQMYQRFWVQWSAEYLHTLHQRKKWQTRQPNYNVGDLVLIMDENRPPSVWPLGRITETHAGADGNIRVVTLRTATQTMKRSIVKLARLPTQGHDQSAESSTRDDAATKNYE